MYSLPKLKVLSPDIKYSRCTKSPEEVEYTFVIRGWWKELQVANRRNHHSFIHTTNLVSNKESSKISRKNINRKENSSEITKNRRELLTKDAAGEDVLPVVPVVIYPRDGDDGGDEERQDDDAQLGDVPSSVEDGDLPGKVPRQETQAGERPCTTARQPDYYPRAHCTEHTQKNHTQLC